ncbi:MAG TPA: TonB family protein [Bryobacteraceae bacterium]|nr:TonB family protein [Bryobacteraceae bacterium]
METLVNTPVDGPPELNLLTNWEADRGRVREAGLLSIAAHAAAIVALILMPRSLISPPHRTATQITPLIEPPTELTQKAPNKGPIAKEVTVEALQPRPKLQAPRTPPATTRPVAQIKAPPQPPPAPLPEPPKIEAGNREAQPPRALPAGPPVIEAMPPQIQDQEKPKLAFEAPTAPPPSGGTGRIARPDTSVEGAIKELTHSGSQGGLTVSDDSGDVGVGGIGPGLNLPPSAGRAASALELLSDPKGVDFKPYLIQVLASVRRNWFAVYPESARMGLRGRVEAEFVIAKDGSIPKLVLVLHSVPALDRAAVAGIDASHPFPPFPREFTGDRIVLKLTFSYNMPRDRRR